MIKRLHVPYIARTIPLAFDESLSYLETLYAILKKLNDVIDTVNQHTEIIEEMGETINSINEEIVNLNIKLENLETWTKNYVEENIDNLKSQVNEQLADLLKNVNTLLDNMKTVIDNEISSLRDELMAEIDEIQAGLVEIYNPFSGLTEPIAKVVMDMYEALRDEAITAEEYDSLELTATEYDSKQITARDYDLKGKTILMGKKGIVTDTLFEQSTIEPEYIYEFTLPTANQYDELRIFYSENKGNVVNTGIQNMNMFSIHCQEKSPSSTSELFFSYQKGSRKFPETYFLKALWLSTSTTLKIANNGSAIRYQNTPIESDTTERTLTTSGRNITKNIYIYKIIGIRY